MEDKKVYPSQINTKTISLRLPLSEYSNILSEAVKLGITMSDYLILKIYNNSQIGNSQLDQPKSNQNLSFTINKNDFKDAYNEWYFDPEYDQPFNLFWNEFSKDVRYFLLGDCFNENTGTIAYDDEDEQRIKDELVSVLIKSHKRLLELKFWKELSKNTSVKDASLIDVKTQLTVLIKRKFKLTEDQREYRKDLFELLKELD